MERAGQEAYEFRHALLQEAVYGELLPGQRARLHGAYADVLAGSPPGLHATAPQFPAELAEHWYRARRPAEALAWSVRAAGSAERVYAHGEAARQCERALELWDQVPDAAVRAGLDRAGMHTWAARAREHVGDQGRALWHVEEALRQLDRAAEPVRAGLLHHLRGWYADRDGRSGRAACCQPGGGPAGTGRAAVNRARPCAAGLRPRPPHSGRPVRRGGRSSSSRR